ncbi:MAG: DUF6443 domain-containing protein, partial [Bacteroidota bacterium]
MNYLLFLGITCLSVTTSFGFQALPDAVADSLSSRAELPAPLFPASMGKLLTCSLPVPFVAKEVQPDTEHSFVLTSSFREASSMTSAPLTSQQLTYFDGLGREVQQVGIQAAPTGADLVSPIVYDPLGRVSHSYLPFASDGDSPTSGNLPLAGRSGSFRENSLQQQASFYESLYSLSGSRKAPFSVSQFEASPLNRVVEQGAAGEAWQPFPGSVGLQQAGEHTITTAYLTNAKPVGG